MGSVAAVVAIGVVVGSIFKGSPPSPPGPAGSPPPTREFGIDGEVTFESGFKDGVAFSKTFGKEEGFRRAIEVASGKETAEGFTAESVRLQKVIDSINILPPELKTRGKALIAERTKEALTKLKARTDKTFSAKAGAAQRNLDKFLKEKEIATEKKKVEDARLVKLKADRTATQSELQKQLDDIIANPEAGFDQAAFRSSIKGSVDSLVQNLRNPILEDRKKLEIQDAQMFAARGATGSRAQVDLAKERQLTQERVDQEIGNIANTFEQNLLQSERAFFTNKQDNRRNFLQQRLLSVNEAITSEEVLQINKELANLQKESIKIEQNFNRGRAGRFNQELQANLSIEQAKLRQQAFESKLRQFNSNRQFTLDTITGGARIFGAFSPKKPETGQTPGINPSPVASATPINSPFNRGQTPAKSPFQTGVFSQKPIKKPTIGSSNPFTQGSKPF